jgi:hypothetical protein
MKIKIGIVTNVDFFLLSLYLKSISLFSSAANQMLPARSKPLRCDPSQKGLFSR